MPPNQAVSPISSFIPLILIFLVFYFLIIKPQSDKQKQHREMLGQLKKNDEVVTAGGIHGTIVAAKETTLVVRIDENVKVEIDRDAISRVTKKSA